MNLCESVACFRKTLKRIFSKLLFHFKSQAARTVMLSLVRPMLLETMINDSVLSRCSAWVRRIKVISHL